MVGERIGLSLFYDTDGSELRSVGQTMDSCRLNALPMLNDSENG
jgi:hypothetical protein